jgi:predicted PurR-regulated permease PerM
MFFLVEKRGWKKGLTAALLMVLTFLIILIPIWTLVQMMSTKIAYAIQHSEELVQAIQIVIGNIEEKMGIDLISTENLNKLSNFVAQVVPKILGATFSTLVTIFFTYFILYFMLVNGRKLEQGIYGYMPLKDENVNKIGKEMESIVMSNAIGIPS